MTNNKRQKSVHLIAESMSIQGGREEGVVADDTDKPVFLMYHWNQNMADIYFHSQAKQSQKKGLMMWEAGKVVRSHLLFLRVWSCATIPLQHLVTEKPVLLTL